MTIWAIADLHLSFGTPNKKMDIFGAHWENHAEKIENNWRKLVAPEDLVLIPGDISWAMRVEEARTDLDWIGGLPGTKVLLRGNHDYWWESLSKIKRILPPSCHLIQNNHFMWGDIAIAGARLWDTDEFNFSCLVNTNSEENDKSKILTESDHSEEREKIFNRELGRLEVSLKSIPSSARGRIAMTHYPPIGVDLKDSKVSRLLERHQINACVFGHLHNVQPGNSLFGIHNQIRYHLVACDYLNFVPYDLKFE